MITITYDGKSIGFGIATIDEAEAWIAGHNRALPENRDDKYQIVGRRRDFDKEKKN